MTSDNTPATVCLNGVYLQQVEEFKYLGSIIRSRSIAASTDISHRLGLATSAFGSLAWCIWRKKALSVVTKVRLYRTLILPILLYGAETWVLLDADLKKLEVFQMRCLRRILGVNLLDKIPNVEIRARCSHQPTVESLIRRARLRWFGHVCRMEERRLPYQALWRTRPETWKVSRNAPKKTWIKQVEKDLANYGITSAHAKENATRDRKWWKEIIEFICTGNFRAAPTVSYQLRPR